MVTWENFIKNYIHNEILGISLDFSGINFDSDFFKTISSHVDRAYGEMGKLESGAIANPDENRQVGHYWLRNPTIAPTTEIQNVIESTVSGIIKFSNDVHFGNIRSQSGIFRNILCIGIGGSALGPQLMYSSLCPSPKMQAFFIDNTDPDGIDVVLNKIRDQLANTLVIVTSKSGSTPEPRNAMLEIIHAYEKAGISFQRQAIAITSSGSKLHNQATSEGWIKIFPMFDWIGGRTSITSSVGLLPAALVGVNINEFLAGAKGMDSWTRTRSDDNPAMKLALAWHFATNGHGKKDMVIIPYKDRLVDFPKYLQQLIMESIGKEKDLNGKIVNQGISVYGNKGSTDQHSYIQQLRDGVNNFFATIIEVLNSRKGSSMEVDEGVTSGNYLHGFSLGTEKALSSNNRQTIVITIKELDAFSLGMLIALYERTVGFYATMVGINAYHQPGVEAGKKAAANILNLQRSIVAFLKKQNKPLTISEICNALPGCDDKKSVFKILEQLSANNRNMERIFPGNFIEKITYRLKS